MFLSSRVLFGHPVWVNLPLYPISDGSILVRPCLECHAIVTIDWMIGDRQDTTSKAFQYGNILTRLERDISDCVVVKYPLS